MLERRSFLPVNRQEMRERGWEQADFVYISGDAYVDHPSFGAAIITRLLEDAGYRVAFLAQPDWKDEKSVTVCGEPRLAFLVSAGNMDSMVNHYTAARKRRHQDAYTPGGGFSGRPDRAVTVYGNLIRRVYKKTPILIGGIEASLRRMAHYDYWSDKVRRSVLLDSGADLLMYGMGERSVLEIAEALAGGIDVKDITYVRGTVFKCKDLSELSGDYVRLPSYPEILASKESYAKSCRIQYENTDAITAKRLVEPYKEKEYVVQNPPAYPLTTEELDHVYELPYMRTWHPSCEKDGGVPALGEVRFSLVSSRGCFGGCNFCALTFHQGRRVQVRSHASLVREAELLTREPGFKGYIHDVGGPTADFRHPSCQKQLKCGVCTHRQCLFPKPCPNLDASHADYIALLKKLRAVEGVKKVFIRSGIRFDYVLAEQDGKFLSELCRYHVSGQLKVAPEHISDAVLRRMGKPENAVFETFKREYGKVNRRLGKKQYLVPYLMSSHPGSGLREAVELAEYVRDLGYMPEQVQDFYPTPGTISTCMYYTGLDPRTMEKVYVPVSQEEKRMQRALIQYRNPANYALVKKALILAGRTDLIGYGEKCLIRPRPDAREKNAGTAEGSRRGKPADGRQPAAASEKKRRGKSAAGRPSAGPERENRGARSAQGRPPAGEDYGNRSEKGQRKTKRKTIRNIHRKKSI